MMSVLRVVFIFATFFAKGNTLSCYECVDPAGESCTGNSRTCISPEDRCISAYSETTVDSAGVTVKVLARSCDKDSMCNQVYSISSPMMKTKVTTACCNTDNCTPGKPAVTPASTKPNGVTCRSCFEQNSASCYNQETRNCTGEENKCIRFATQVTGAVSAGFALRGCATENICATENSSKFFGGISVKVDMACTDSSIRPEHSLFLPILTGCIVLKLSF